MRRYDTKYIEKADTQCGLISATRTPGVGREQAFAALQHFFRFGQKAAVQVIILNVRSILVADLRTHEKNGVQVSVAKKSSHSRHT